MRRTDCEGGEALVSGIGRREFLLLGGSAAAWPLAARAQQPTMPVIGFLNPGSPAEWAPRVAAFKNGLAETGYVEGRNVAIDYRWGGDRYEPLPELAADLVRRGVAVIFTTGTPAGSLAARAATSSIPIVFVIGTDSVDAGLVANLSRPDANLTGVNVLSTLLSAKRQQILQEVVPSAASVAMLVNPSNTSNRFELPEATCAPPCATSVSRWGLWGRLSSRRGSGSSSRTFPIWPC
jgi:putative ABC transport system substrate-binding protein